MLRVTLDSNIDISAVKFGGKPLHILTMAGEGHVEIAVSEVTIDEVLRVLATNSNGPVAAGRQRNAHCVNCAPAQTLNVVKNDPDDNRIIECAMAARSTAIVTGDKHLLRLGDYEGIAIMRVTNFLAECF